MANLDTKQPTMIAPICFVQALVFITNYQGHVLHVANDINPTVRPIVAMPRATPTIANQLVRIHAPHTASTSRRLKYLDSGTLSQSTSRKTPNSLLRARSRQSRRASSSAFRRPRARTLCRLLDNGRPWTLTSCSASIPQLAREFSCFLNDFSLGALLT